ncbi:MAG: SMC-Scp complex subunit ScpB [Clostridia bacterium]|nr:SMC-Scp complex subunit ScpB [Clostridia bacterium]
MEIKELACSIEAILFAAGYPVEVIKLMETTGADKDQFEDAIGVLNEKYDGESGVRLVFLDGRYQLCTNEKYLDIVREALGIRRGGNLSRASLEVLAVIAYNQPTTRSFIEQVRGVDCTYTVSSLLEKGLIEVCGKLDAPGRPSLYKTSPDFLRVFGLSSVHDLPPFEVFDENGQVTLKPL